MEKQQNQVTTDRPFSGSVGSGIERGEKEVARGASRFNADNGDYPIDEQRRADLDRQFTYHPPVGTQQRRYEDIRVKSRELAELILSTTPPSREQALCLTNLEQAAFWGNAAIARNESQM